MTKWEYQVAPIPLHNEALMLNNFGQDGWELVAIQTNDQGGRSPSSSARRRAEP